MSFKDYFSTQAESYAKYRPEYPSALFEYLVSVCSAHDLAWDCGTGNGQAAAGLAPYFSGVIATDASEEQIRNARPCGNVSYQVRPSDDSGLAGETVDLVTVAQALHWFDLSSFYSEVDRVLKPGGVLAAWCYGLSRISPAVDPVLQRFYSETVGPYWPPERASIDTGYGSMAFPFDSIVAPDLAIEKELSLVEFAGYLRTWSAVQAYTRDRNEDPVAQALGDLERGWGDPEKKRLVRWPLSIRIGKRRG